MMKKITLLLWSIALINIAFAQTYSPDFLDGRVMFKLKKEVKAKLGESSRIDNYSLSLEEKLSNYPDLSKELKDYNVTKLERPCYYNGKKDLMKIYQITFSNFSKIDEIVEKLERLDWIEYAEKKPIYKTDFIPNDPQYTGTTKWYHDLVGSEAAWDISQGSNTIKVAIVDNAVFADHTDLTTFLQRDVADNDNDATPPLQYSADQGWSHGTHTSGLATADINNSIGIASLGAQVELIGVKATPNNAPSSSSIYYSFEGVSWACANGANVVSMSYGGTNQSGAMQNLIDAYPEVVFLAAAGNDGNTVVQYPGGYNNVICVGSVDGNNNRSNFSNYNGSTPFVDIASPGGYTYGGLQSTVYTTNGNGYGKMGGTSMATPFAAGLVGNMLSINPTLTPAQIESCLITTGVATGGSGDIGPRIDAPAALTCVAATVTGDPLVQFVGSPISIFEGQTVTFVDQSASGGNAITNWEWAFPGGSPASFIGQTPPVVTYATAGVYTVSLTVTNSQSQQTKTRTDYINVSLEPYGEWIIQNSGFATVSTGITHLDIVDINTVWALAYDGSGGGGNPQEFTKTTDGGTNWNVQSIDIGDIALGTSMISAIDDMNAWLVAYPNAAGQIGGIWKTTDGGVNWNRQSTAVYNDAASFSNVVHFWDANNGFCQGDPIGAGFGEYENYTTTNGGTTWTPVPGANIPNPLSGEYGYVRDIEVVGDTVWYGTNKGRLYHSTDRGYTWAVYQTPETDMGNAKYSFTNGTTGLLVSGTLVYKTTDAGANWNQLTTTGSVFTGGLCYIEGTDIAFTTGTGSSYSEDGGINWNIIDTDQHTYVDFINPTVGWSGSFTVSAVEHGIWKWNSLNANLNADFTASPLNVCVGDTVYFSDLTTGGNVTDWGWQFFGGTAIDNTVQNPLVTYAAAGTYSVQMTVTDSVGQTTTSKGSYITVVSPPAAPIGISGLVQVFLV
jgi:PKD repeat protein